MIAWAIDHWPAYIRRPGIRLDAVSRGPFFVPELMAVDPSTIPAPLLAWLQQAYASDITGGNGPGDGLAAAEALPALLAMLTEPTAQATRDTIACATGDSLRIQARIAADPTWLDRPGGVLALPPLLAITHSRLVCQPRFGEALRTAARTVLAAGANANASVGNRGWPNSLQAPNDREPISALYGAAGRHHDAALTRMLLDAGADPNDGESLYHALESLDCTRLLLAAGARITGSNAFYRAFDLDDVRVVELLLAAGADPNEPALNSPLDQAGSPLLWAIYRRRSAAHVAALLAAGADATRRTAAGHSALQLAVRQGLDEVADRLRHHGVDDDSTEVDRFLGACAKADRAEVERLRANDPGLLGRLTPADRRLLPELAAAGEQASVELMVASGWPLEVTGGDWGASALNQSIFRGDARMTDTLLAAGARWQTRHGYGGDALGTLSFASQHRPVPDGDWIGCAAALRRHGLAAGAPDPERPGWTRVGDGSQPYPEAIAAVLVGAIEAAAPPVAAPLAGDDEAASLQRVRADLARRAPGLQIEIAATSTATVALAAVAFGVPPAQIAKTLALRVADRVLLVVASGDRRLDNKKIRTVFGAKGRMLDPEETRAITGHPVGGVCPFGLLTDLPIYCDRSLQAFDVVLPAAGSLTSAVRIAPTQLAALTGERWVDVCQD